MTNSSVFTGSSLCAQTAHETVKQLKAKQVSPEELLDASYERIATAEPSINALPTLCEERARESLKGLTENAKQNQDHPGWLAGLPISIKDLNAVSGVRTTFGTKGLADFVHDFSDPMVERLESRGAIIVGKSNTPEMGAGGNTFNDVFGRTRNPWDTRKNAGGSSGGAAASLAAGETWLAHGSDLAGSLRTPAGYCGVVGLRPSPGRAGGGPAAIAFNGDAVSGPMARNVLDCALFLDAMSGFDRRLPISVEAPATSFQQSVLQAESPKCIAYSPDLNGFAAVEPEIDQILRACLSSLEKDGVVVEEACPQIDNLDTTYRVFRGLVWAALPGRLPEEVQKYYKRTLAENIAYCKNLSVDDIVDAQMNRATLYATMEKFLQDYDVLACPVVGLEPGMVEEEYPKTVNGVPMDDYVDWLRFSFLSTTTGLPSIALPAGRTASGMPVGIQLIGQPRGEAGLLATAAAVERVANMSHRVPLDPV